MILPYLLTFFAEIYLCWFVIRWLRVRAAKRDKLFQEGILDPPTFTFDYSSPFHPLADIRKYSSIPFSILGQPNRSTASEVATRMREERQEFYRKRLHEQAQYPQDPVDEDPLNLKPKEVKLLPAPKDD